MDLGSVGGGVRETRTQGVPDMGGKEPNSVESVAGLEPNLLVFVFLRGQRKSSSCERCVNQALLSRHP
jgi:hypothetical protein